MAKTILKTAFMASTALTASLLGTAAAVAQVETIVVTSQRREATLLETPVAVSAVSSEQVELSQIRDVRDLQLLVPSLRVNQFSRPGVTELSIRGIGSSGDNIGLEPSVAAFVDGVYLPRSAASIGDFLSVERIEVLRGPQSTLFGRNASAGVLSVITQAPEYEFGAQGELTIGNYDSFIARASVTGPLTEGVAFRLDGNINTRDGFLDNLTTGQSVNDRNRSSIRGQLLVEPSNDLSIRLIAGYENIDEDCCAAPFSEIFPANGQALAFLGGTLLPTDPFERNVAFDGPLNTNIENAYLSGQVDIDFEGFTVTSITAFSTFEDSNVIDADFTDLPLGQPRRIRNTYDAFTQEFRVASTGGGPVDWIAGVFYYQQDLDQSQNRPYGAALRPFFDLATGNAVTDLETALGLPAGTFLADGQGLIQEDYALQTDSWSAFAQLDWHVTDRLTLTGGLRYTDEEKDVVADIEIFDPWAALDFVAIGEQQIFATVFSTLTGLPPTPANIGANPGAAATAQAQATAGSTDPTINDLLLLTPLQLTPPAPDFSRSREEDNVSGNFIISFDLTDDINTYFSYSRGFKAGGFNVDSSASRNNAFEFDEEITIAYEFGVKANLFDGRLNVNSAYFDQTIEDFQANVFTGTSFVLDNAGEITIRGIELEAIAQPTDRWLLTGGITYLLDAEYADYDNAPCDDLNLSASCLLTNTQDLTGRQLTGAANTTASATATYFQPIGSLESYWRGEVFYTSDRNMGSDLDPRKEEDAYTLFNASVGLRNPEGNWELQFWGRNIFDEDYLQGEFSSVGQPGSLNAYPGDPRTYGLTLRLRN